MILDNKKCVCHWNDNYMKILYTDRHISFYDRNLKNKQVPEYKELTFSGIFTGVNTTESQAMMTISSAKVRIFHKHLEFLTPYQNRTFWISISTTEILISLKSACGDSGLTPNSLIYENLMRLTSSYMFISLILRIELNK